MTRALVVGAGGLGGPIATALAAAGLDVAIADPDVVEASNLHRQIQFTAADLGEPKAARLAARLGERARGLQARWSAESADALAAGAALLVDASDDPATKFSIADYAVAHGLPYVIAAALRYGGNAFAGAPGAACYRCLFEEPAEAASCADAGVLGPVVGAIGGVAAALALGLAAGDRSQAGALFAWDDLRVTAEPRIVRFEPRAGCSACARAPKTEAA